MKATSVAFLFGAAIVIAAGPAAAALRFEDAVRASDRIVVGTIEHAGAGVVPLERGRSIDLGIVDPASGLVFTPYRIRIDECLLDSDVACAPGELEALVPGGTVYEIVGGERRLRTWEIAGVAGVPLPPVGSRLLLFMTKRNGRFVALGDRNGRAPVDDAGGVATVALELASPRFLSESGRDAVRLRLAAGNAAFDRPRFAERVEIGRLPALIRQVLTVPLPTSGTRHAAAALDHPDDARARERRDGIRAGEDSERKRSPVGVGDDRVSPRGPHDDRRR
jgi:hypothetical protein